MDKVSFSGIILILSTLSIKDWLHNRDSISSEFLDEINCHESWKIWICMRLINFPSTLLNCFVWNALCSKEKQLRSILRKFLRYNYLQIILLLGQDKLQHVFFCKLIHITWNKDHLNFFLVSKESHDIRDILQWKTSLLALKDDMWFIW